MTAPRRPVHQRIDPWCWFAIGPMIALAVLLLMSNFPWGAVIAIALAGIVLAVELRVNRHTEPPPAAPANPVQRRRPPQGYPARGAPRTRQPQQQHRPRQAPHRPAAGTRARPGDRY